MSEILDGKLVAKVIKEKISQQIESFKNEFNRTPKLTVILIGDNAASAVYVKNKEKACKKVGIQSECLRFPETISTEKLISTIKSLNSDKHVDGILVQLPLPSHISSDVVISAISPSKDVDCFHPENIGKMWLGTSKIAPCTPAGILRILDHYKIPVEGRHVVIIGRSNIVGKPLACLFLERNATVTIAHSRSRYLNEISRGGDILVTAIGKPGIITKEYIKDDAIVLDVGINRITKQEAKSHWLLNENFVKRFARKDTILIGDVDPLDVSQTASYYTPVPGGVGPMTVTMLLENTLTLAYERERLSRLK